METTQEERPARGKGFKNVAPIVQLAGSDNAPVINYNIPESTSYTGRHAVELRISPIDEENNKIFNMDAFTSIPFPSEPSVVTIGSVTEAMINGFSDDTMFPLVKPYAGLIRLVGSGKPEDPYQIVSNQNLSTELRNLHPQEVFSALLAKKSLMIYRTMFGSLSYRYVEPITGTVIPAGQIINGGEPIEREDPLGIFFSLASPGNNAELMGPRPRYRILINGACSSVEHKPSPELWKVEVQVGSHPWVTAALVASTNDVKWSADYVFNTEGPSTITAKFFGPMMGPEGRIITANIKTSFSNQTTLRPRLLLLESYRLESHLGQYGAGRIIKTFTLLPGEKTSISTRTYTKTETDAKRASSVLDSVTEESTREFENSLSTEQTDKKNYEESFSYEINAKAQAVWGWGSANVSGQVRGASNSAHEEFSKNISNAIQKHASTASSKREVQINTSYEEKRIEEVETSIEREVKNINVSRTLNFVFRQMNQEHITALCLVDARVAVWDGNPDPSTSVRVEVALPELQYLLERFLVEERRKEMEEAIITELSFLFDYEGETVIDFIKQEPIFDRNGNPARTYWRVNPKRTTDYGPDVNENEFTVQGVLVKADRHVMRTDGVMVEALLGEVNALDNYSEGLQNESIRARELENQLKEAEIRKSRLAISTVDKGPKEQVERFERIFPCCKPTIFSLWPPKEEDGKKENARRETANTQA